MNTDNFTKVEKAVLYIVCGIIWTVHFLPIIGFIYILSTIH